MVSDHDASMADEGWPEGRFVGREAFQDAAVRGIRCAAHHAVPTVWLSDTDFAAWPLGERRMEMALDAWAAAVRDHPQAHMRVLAQSFGDMRLRHARFVRWRERWSHRVEVRVTPIGPEGPPSVIWTPHWTLQRVDPVRDVAVATVDARQRTQLEEALQRHWHQARPGFASTTLGL